MRAETLLTDLVFMNIVLKTVHIEVDVDEYFVLTMSNKFKFIRTGSHTFELDSSKRRYIK